VTVSRVDLRVRRARVQDAGGIARTWVRAWEVAYRGLVPDAVLDGLRPRGDHACLWVFADNHPARAFCARFGLTPDGCERVDEGTGLTEIRLRADL
jgi:hypothetical protein